MRGGRNDSSIASPPPPHHAVDVHRHVLEGRVDVGGGLEGDLALVVLRERREKRGAEAWVREATSRRLGVLSK